MPGEQQPAVQPLSAEEREQIRALHQMGAFGESSFCRGCDRDWPCLTARWEATCAALENRAKRAEAERAAAREMLVWFEWATGGYCAACFGTRVTGHAPGCPLARAPGRPECQP